MVIPNGVNEAHFQRAPSTSAAKARLGLAGRLVLGFTGFVRDWHGVDRVVRWMHDSAPSSVHLLVVGDGPARAGLEALAAELDVAERVTFTGVVERAEVPAHVAAFDIALQPAVVGYASPLKLFEYMALGKAIVAPRQPNVEEVLIDGSNALLFDAGNARGLQVALERLVGDAALRSALGAEAARTISRQGFSWRENARRVVALGERYAQHAPPAGKRYPWRSAD
jgi:glycosyltransferase involved in cell wall biosynthesis